MKKIFFSLMCLSAALFTLVSCSDDPKNPINPDQPDKTPLSKPVVMLDNQDETSFTISWAKVTDAVEYAVVLNDGAEEKTTETTKTFSDLKAGDYTAKVKAVADPACDKCADSDWTEISVTIKSNAPAVDNAWVGEWTISTTQTLLVEQKKSSLLDEPWDMDVTIEIFEDDPKGQTLLITGLSSVDAEIPSLAMFDEFTLSLLSGVQVGEEDQGFIPTWTGFAEVEGMGIVPLGGQYKPFTFTLSKDETSANASALEGSVTVDQQGTKAKYTMVGYEVLAAAKDGSGFAFYTDAFPVKLPGGEYSMVKKTAAAEGKYIAREVAAEKPNYKKTMMYNGKFFRF